MYFFPGFSVILCIVSFVLMMLIILAGHSPGFMEDAHILYFNTSSLGKNIVSSLEGRAPMPEPTAPPTLLHRFHAVSNEKRGIVGDAMNGANEVKSDAVAAGSAAGSAATSAVGDAKSAASSAAGDALSALSDIENDIADQLAKKLGIKEFYSIHLVDLCYGDFEPNATDPHATFNVTNCTTPFHYNLLNVSSLLDHELRVGPFSLNLADLGFTQDIQDKLNEVPKIIQALVAMYITSAVFIGGTLIASIAAVVIIPKPSGKMIVRINFGCASLAAFFLLIGNLVISVGNREVVKKVTDIGNDIGLYAEQGHKFIAMIWATFALMLLAVGYWIYEIRAEKRRGSEAINRAIGGFSFGAKSEPAWSETSSGLASRENSFPQQHQQQQHGMGGEYPPTHAPVSPMSMDDIPLEEHNYGRGTHEPPPVSPLEQAGYGHRF